MLSDYGQLIMLPLVFATAESVAQSSEPDRPVVVVQGQIPPELVPTAGAYFDVAIEYDLGKSEAAAKRFKNYQTHGLAACYLHFHAETRTRGVFWDKNFSEFGHYQAIRLKEYTGQFETAVNELDIANPEAVETWCRELSSLLEFYKKHGVVFDFFFYDEWTLQNRGAGGAFTYEPFYMSPTYSQAALEHYRTYLNDPSAQFPVPPYPGSRVDSEGRLFRTADPDVWRRWYQWRYDLFAEYIGKVSRTIKQVSPDTQIIFYNYHLWYDFPMTVDYNVDHGVKLEIACDQPEIDYVVAEHKWQTLDDYRAGAAAIYERANTIGKKSGFHVEVTEYHSSGHTILPLDDIIAQYVQGINYGSRMLMLYSAQVIAPRDSKTDVGAAKRTAYVLSQLKKQFLALPVINRSQLCPNSDLEFDPDTHKTWLTQSEGPAECRWRGRHGRCEPHCLEISIQDAGGTGRWVGKTLPAEQNWQYAASAWVETVDLDGAARLGVEWLAADGQPVRTDYSRSLSGTRGYTRVTVPDAVSPDRAVTMRLLVEAAGDGPGVVRADEIQLRANWVWNPTVDKGTNRPDHWDTSNASVTHWDDTVARSGRRSLRIGPTTETAAWACGPILTGDVQEAYTFSTWVRARKATGRNYLEITWRDVDGTLLGATRSVSISGTCDWKRIHVTGSPPSGTVYSELRAVSEDNTGQVWFDDFDLSGKAARP